MIIEIEGTDLSGKTTIINKLKQDLKNSKFSFVKFEKNPLNIFDPNFSFVSLGYIYAVAELDTQLNFNVIFDRLMLSNYVYERILPERKISITDSILHKFYSNYNIITLILKIDDLELKNRFDKRGDEYFKFKKIKDANNKYGELYNILKPTYPSKIFSEYTEFLTQIKKSDQ